METFLGLDYPTWWFLVVGGLFSGYAILDGFDFGAGAWHLFLKKENSRRIALNAVGPVWDGNEVWLVIGGGALFAGFPVMYATMFSSLYIPFMMFPYVNREKVKINTRKKVKGGSFLLTKSNPILPDPEICSRIKLNPYFGAPGM